MNRKEGWREVVGGVWSGGEEDEEGRLMNWQERRCSSERAN